MIIGIPKETQNNESRVSMAPDSIKKLSKLGLKIKIYNVIQHDKIRYYDIYINY